MEPQMFTAQIQHTKSMKNQSKEMNNWIYTIANQHVMLPEKTRRLQPPPR